MCLFLMQFSRTASGPVQYKIMKIYNRLSFIQNVLPVLLGSPLAQDPASVDDPDAFETFYNTARSKGQQMVSGHILKNILRTKWGDWINDEGGGLEPGLLQKGLQFDADRVFIKPKARVSKPHLINTHVYATEMESPERGNGNTGSSSRSRYDVIDVKDRDGEIVVAQLKLIFTYKFHDAALGHTDHESEEMDFVLVQMFGARIKCVHSLLEFRKLSGPVVLYELRTIVRNRWALKNFKTTRQGPHKGYLKEDGVLLWPF